MKKKEVKEKLKDLIINSALESKEINNLISKKVQDIDLINELKDQLNWEIIISRSDLTNRKEILKKFQNYIRWDLYSPIDLEELLLYKNNNLDWNRLTSYIYNNHLYDWIPSLIDYIDWNILSSHLKVSNDKDLELIYNYKEKINWYYLINNSFLDLNDGSILIDIIINNYNFIENYLSDFYKSFLVAFYEKGSNYSNDFPKIINIFDKFICNSNDKILDWENPYLINIVLLNKNIYLNLSDKSKNKIPLEKLILKTKNFKFLSDILKDNIIDYKNINWENLTNKNTIYENYDDVNYLRLLSLFPEMVNWELYYNTILSIPKNNLNETSIKKSINIIPIQYIKKSNKFKLIFQWIQMLFSRKK